jgi:hypothetical protein
MRTFRWLTLAVPIVAAVWMSQAALAQAPSDEDLNRFVTIFLALQENARPYQAGESPEGRPERRGSPEIVEEHGWTLEQYNQMAHRVNTTSELFERFQTLVEERSRRGDQH